MFDRKKSYGRITSMYKIPKRAALASGKGEGETKLEALDCALLDAGIGNFNLVTVTSIFPTECKVGKIPDRNPGTIIPAVVAKVTSPDPGQKIAASVCIAEGEGSEGVISEFGGKNIDGKEAKKECKEIARRMMKNRNLKIKREISISTEHEVHFIGAAISAVILFP